MSSVTPFVNWVVFSTPGADGVTVLIIIMALLVAAFAISTLLDRRKKKLGK